MRIALAVVLASAASISASPGLPVAPVHTTRTEPHIAFDANGNVARFYGVPINLTIPGLKRLPYRVKMGHIVKEGDRYITAQIQIKDGIVVDAEFVRGRVYRLGTASPNAVGPRGIRVGSRLSDVRAAWPAGKLIYGIGEKNLYVTFLTGANILYNFDPKDMPRDAFDDVPPKDVKIPDLKVQYIRFEDIPVPAH